ncbi:MAG: hypothetical protein K2Z81_26440 [Cyanobacteria bacterium]|nr:hypothetical protein [Cyanobacteriota bacterium]
MNNLSLGAGIMSPKVMALMARHSSPSIRLKVAENSQTPVDLLRKLARDADPEVRIAAGQNDNLPECDLMMLSEDDSVDVRYALASDPLIPQLALENLTEDSNPYVAVRAAETLRALCRTVAASCEAVRESA